MTKAMSRIVAPRSNRSEATRDLASRGGKAALVALLCGALAGCVTITTRSGDAPTPLPPTPALSLSEQTHPLNRFRAAQGLAALAPNPMLEAAAQAHAMDMAEQGFFSHTGSDGGSVGDRARRAGYGWCRIAENIAYGQRDLEEVVEGWINSPGHRANMVLPDLRDYGLARAPGDRWVLVLGRPGC